MFESLKSFVTSEYCLSCRGCCVFKDAGDWAPRASPAEIQDIQVFNDLVPSMFSEGKKLRLVPADRPDTEQCFFLSPSTHHCRAYPVRPLECRMYPFLLSFEKGKFRVYAHLSCPAVQEKKGTALWAEYVKYLCDYFSSPETKRHLENNWKVFADYSGYPEEAEFLFELTENIVGDSDSLLQEKPRVDFWLAQRERLVSAMSFAGLFAWKDFFQFDFKEVAGNLCVYARQNGATFLYWPPLGEKISQEAVAHVFEEMRRDNKGSGVTRIENVSRQELSFFDPARYASFLKGYEYCYYRKDIAELKGNDYKSKRHDINLLERTHTCIYREFVPSDIEQAQNLFDRWLDNRARKYEDDIYRAMLNENKGVHALLWRNAKPLGLVGRVVELDGRLAAYTFGYPLNDETFCVLLEVADPEVTGLAAFIFKEFSSDALVRPFNFLNTMDDFAMPNITQAKMAYRPVYLEPVYSITEKDC
ncbi:MAG: DUF2156 domain-containing protein [Candidatus Omnitrophica bacterium]|nr:DUF2156 domain-containing protein [Candidatus Omnitrophota bacterium]